MTSLQKLMSTFKCYSRSHNIWLAKERDQFLTLANHVGLYTASLCHSQHFNIANTREQTTNRTCELTLHLFSWCADFFSRCSIRPFITHRLHLNLEI